MGDLVDIEIFTVPDAIFHNAFEYFIFLHRRRFSMLGMYLIVYDRQEKNDDFRLDLCA